VNAADIGPGRFLRRHDGVNENPLFDPHFMVEIGSAAPRSGT